MDRGWIMLWRRLLDSRVFLNEGLLKIWIWCLLRANHEEDWVPMKTGKSEIEIHVKPGQFIFGRHSAAKQLKMSPSTIWKRIKKLENSGKLNIESNKQYSIITITNWRRYQPEKEKSDSKGDNGGTTEEQWSDTDNNVNNGDKRFKKITPPMSGQNRNNNSKKLEKYIGQIEEACKQLDELSMKDGKRFNAFQFVEHQLKESGHPGAILETLEGLIIMWPKIKDIWAYARAIMKTKNPNWYEQEHILKSEDYKHIVQKMGEKLKSL